MRPARSSLDLTPDAPLLPILNELEVTHQPNRSAAIRAQRVTDFKRTLDYFPTPADATLPLITFLRNEDYPLASMSCHEPAGGGGHMVDVLSEYFKAVLATDVKNYGRGYGIHDYVGPFCGDHCQTQHCAFTNCAHVNNVIDQGPVFHYPDWVITNPPFALAEQFILRALHHARFGVAMLCRLSFLESAGRHERLFKMNPPSDVLVFVKRIKMVHGRLATDSDGGSATAFAWFVWQNAPNGRRGQSPPKLHWIYPQP